MLIFEEFFNLLKLKFKIENVFHVLMSVIIVIFLAKATIMLLKPIESEKINKVILLSHQASYPNTQQLAQQLLSHEKISAGDYIKLMFAHQQEANRVVEYPAVKIEDNRGK